MTRDQINLLLDLKASKERGGTSMSCGNRNHIATELLKLGMIESNGFMAGSIFYHINEKGLKAMKGKQRK